MMQLNLDSVATQQPFEMLSMVSTSADSMENDLFESHLKHAKQSVDQNAKEGQEPILASRNSNAKRESQETSERQQEETGTARETSNEVGKSVTKGNVDEEGDADAEKGDSEAGNAEVGVPQAEDDASEDEETPESVVATVLPVELALNNRPMETSDGEEIVADQVSDMLDPIEETMPGAPKGLEPDGQPMGLDVAKKSMARPGVPEEQGMEELAASKEVPVEAKQIGENVQVKEEDGLPISAGEGAFASNTEKGQGSSDGSEKPQRLGDDALAEASRLRADTRHQVGRQNRDWWEENEPSEVSTNIEDQTESVESNTVRASQPESIDVVTVSTTAQTEASIPATSRGNGEGIGVVNVGQISSQEQTSSQSSSTTTSEKTSAADQSERARFVQRVARAFESMGDRNGTIRMALHPPELGALKLHLSVRKGAMEARVEVETENARSLLVENLPALRERLAEQNIKVERFDVDFMNRSMGGSSQDAGQQSHSQEQARGRDQTSPSFQEKKQNAPVESASPVRRSSPDRLDILI